MDKKQFIEKIEKHNFQIHEFKQDEKECAELETWTNGGVNMIIALVPFTLESLIEEIENFNVDDQIDLHRKEDQNYRNNFTVEDSLNDFKSFHQRLLYLKNDLTKREKFSKPGTFFNQGDDFLKHIERIESDLNKLIDERLKNNKQYPFADYFYQRETRSKLPTTSEKHMISCIDDAGIMEQLLNTPFRNSFSGKTIDCTILDIVNIDRFTTIDDENNVIVHSFSEMISIDDKARLLQMMDDFDKEFMS